MREKLGLEKPPAYHRVITFAIDAHWRGLSYPPVACASAGLSTWFAASRRGACHVDGGLSPRVCSGLLRFLAAVIFGRFGCGVGRALELGILLARGAIARCTVTPLPRCAGARVKRNNLGLRVSRDFGFAYWAASAVLGARCGGRRRCREVARRRVQGLLPGAGLAGFLTVFGGPGAGIGGGGAGMGGGGAAMAGGAGGGLGVGGGADTGGAAALALAAAAALGALGSLASPASQPTARRKKSPPPNAVSQSGVFGSSRAGSSCASAIAA